MSQPPQEQQNEFTNVFSTGIAVVYLAIMAFSAPWALMSKKFGTVGTRAYWFDVMCSITVLCFLRMNGHPDADLFTATLLLLPCLWLLHFYATVSRKEHVHRQCIGTPRFGDTGAFALGCTIACGFIYLECYAFAIYLIASVLATLFRSTWVEERDHQRTLAMKDALWEQKQMMALYEKYSKGDK